MNPIRSASRRLGSGVPPQVHLGPEEEDAPTFRLLSQESTRGPEQLILRADWAGFVQKVACVERLSQARVPCVIEHRVITVSERFPVAPAQCRNFYRTEPPSDMAVSDEAGSGLAGTAVDAAAASRAAAASAAVTTDSGSSTTGFDAGPDQNLYRFFTSGSLN